MLGVLYCVICLSVGRVFEEWTFPLWKATFRRIANPIWLRISFCLLSGTLCVTWLVYGISYLSRQARHPLAYGDGIVMTGAALAVLIFLLSKKKRRTDRGLWITDRKLFYRECVFFLAMLVFIAWWMWYVFHQKDGVLYAGFTVFGDFSPHTAMVRSFSWGDNFPTQYPYFGGEDVRYHFMFQFLVGNLEYLGIPMELGFLLLGAVFFLTMVMLLYTLAQWIFRSFSIGVLTGIFLCFRSSFSFWRFAWEHIQAGDLWETLKSNAEFIGYTANEDWGLWNLNVYLNQRHLSIGVGVLCLALLLYLPVFWESFDSGERGLTWLRGRFLQWRAWRPRSVGRAVLAGALLGIAVFWNGAMVIGALLVLAGLAIFSDAKLDYGVTALIALAASWIQSSFFMEGKGMDVQLQFGFLAESPTLLGSFGYLLALYGVFFPAVAVTAFFLGRQERCILAAATLPLVFAFTVSLTPDIAVNHKYVMLTVMFQGIFLSWGLRKLWSRNVVQKGAVCAVVGMLTVTGLYDMVVIYKDNDAQHSFQISLEDDVTLWLKENSDSEDLFLTPQYSLTRVTVSGIMMYCGWPYYGWSAGYDTDLRISRALRMYQTEDQKELRALVECEGITYIIYEDGMEIEGQQCQEETISQAYSLAYTSEDGTLRIYATS